MHIQNCLHFIQRCKVIYELQQEIFLTIRGLNSLLLKINIRFDGSHPINHIFQSLIQKN